MTTSQTSIEDVPLNGFHKLLTLRSGGGSLVDGYVLSIIGVCMVQMTAALQLTSFWLWWARQVHLGPRPIHGAEDHLDQRFVT